MADRPSTPAVLIEQVRTHHQAITHSRRIIKEMRASIAQTLTATREFDERRDDPREPFDWFRGYDELTPTISMSPAPHVVIQPK
jgi:hypothetical protein